MTQSQTFFKDLNSKLAKFSHTINLIGTPTSEIVELEQRLGLRLPQAYREFLSIMGTHHAPFFVGTTTEFKYLETNNDWAIQLLQECNSSLTLPKDAIVIYEHQGYIFLFFRVSDGENPPIWGFNEMSPEAQFKLIAPSFTDFVYEAIDRISKLDDDLISRLNTGPR